MTIPHPGVLTAVRERRKQSLSPVEDIIICGFAVGLDRIRVVEQEKGVRFFADFDIYKEPRNKYKDFSGVITVGFSTGIEKEVNLVEQKGVLLYGSCLVENRRDAQDKQRNWDSHLWFLKSVEILKEVVLSEEKSGLLSGCGEILLDRRADPRQQDLEDVIGFSKHTSLLGEGHLSAQGSILLEDCSEASVDRRATRTNYLMSSTISTSKAAAIFRLVEMGVLKNGRIDDEVELSKETEFGERTFEWIDYLNVLKSTGLGVETFLTESKTSSLTDEFSIQQENRIVDRERYVVDQVGFSKFHNLDIEESFYIQVEKQAEMDDSCQVETV